MLLPYTRPVFASDDCKLFDALVPFDHWTRRADKHIDFLALREFVESLFSDEGRPAIEPVLFLKLELISFHDNLSDGQVFERSKTDLAYRRFLGLGRNDHLPDVSTFGRFRARLGVDGHKKVFHAVLAQARGYGLVKDRLRIKDATHVIADIAIPAGLQLIAQGRNKLLAAAEPFDGELVSSERIRLETIRETTDTCGNDARLAARVEHLRDILAWTDELRLPDDADQNPTWQKLVEARDIARKALSGHDDPKAPGKMRSTVDPDARRGRHGEYYDGYLLDAMIDADSELFTAVNVMPANGNESADALVLLEQEQSAHENTIEKLSIDGAGYDGPVIRAIESDHKTEVYVPPKASSSSKFSSTNFELSEDGSHATCPAGEQSQYTQRDNSRHATAYRFNTQTCHSCPLASQCIAPNQKHGRTVHKNDYDPEYEMIRNRAQTTEYAEVKQEHPKVERRLGELINRHGSRRARYRGTARVFVQQLMAATTANLKRIVRLIDTPIGFATS